MASSASSTAAGGFMVVTHVHPLPTQAQPAGPMHSGQQQPGPQQSLGSQRFSKGRPMALGTVQIMIGMITLLFGIAMVVYADTLGIYSGFFIWGASMYIVAGSLTVAAVKNMKLCLVNGALGCCVVAAIFAFTAVILYSMDAAGVMFYCHGSDYPGHSGYWPSDCYIYWSRMQGISGVLAVFHLLEFIVSITVAAYACYATCNCSEQQSSRFVVPENALMIPNAQTPTVTQTYLPTVSELLNTKDPEEYRATGQTEPPPYNV